MGNTLTLLSNKVQYEVSKVLSDPKAAEFAKQQANKAAEEKAYKEKLQKDLDTTKPSESFEDEPDVSEEEELSDRSKTDSGKLAGDTAYWVIIIILICILILIGIVASNESIGYNTGFRLFWFIYGIPGVIYTKISNLFTKDPKKMVFTSNFPFTLDYNETDHTKKAREDIIESYKEGAPKYAPDTQDYAVGTVKPPPPPAKPPSPPAASPAAKPSAPPPSPQSPLAAKPSVPSAPPLAKPPAQLAPSVPAKDNKPVSAQLAPAPSAPNNNSNNNPT
jgi:hypothetical protein